MTDDSAGGFFVRANGVRRVSFRASAGLLTYCRYEGGVEGVLAESEQQTCLADPAVPDQQQLEEVIVRFGHLKRTVRRLDKIRDRYEPESTPSGSPPPLQASGRPVPK